MRRIIAIIGAAAMLATVAAAPASATQHREESTALNIFWYIREPLTEDTYRLTTWYVGVYADEYGTFSDLYEDVSICHIRPGYDRCDSESFRVGFSDLSGPDESFTMDADSLTTAHLEGVYRLRGEGPDGEPRGQAERTTIVADATGVGDLERSHEKYSYHQGCYHFQTTIKGLSRSATGSGSVNDVDLGATDDAFMATNSSHSVEHTC